MKRKIRVVMAKVGLDGHNRGIKVVSRGLAENGMEVIYLGDFQTPEMVVKAAIDEDADVIGLSSLSGGHMVYFREALELLKKQDAGHILVVGGGVIPKQDAEVLEGMGMSRIFPSGTTIETIVEHIRQHVSARSAEAGIKTK